MTLKLYYNDVGSPARSVLLTAKALGLELELISVDPYFAKEQLTPEFLKMNPQHTVPTLDDNGYYLWDSHAINIYLVNKYGKSDSFYPKDPQKKGIVDQRLFFNAQIIQPRLIAIASPIIRQGVNTIAKWKSDNIIVAYDFLETFLRDHEYMAGDSLTIADFCIVAPISSISYFIPLAQEKYPRLLKWLNKMEQLPYYHEANQVGSDRLIKILESRLS